MKPVHIWGNIALISCYNKECFRQMYRENKKTHFISSKFFFRKLCRFLR